MMPIKKKNFDDITNDILRRITGGEQSDEFKYSAGSKIFTFSKIPVTQINFVEGLLKKTKHTFQKEVDYRQSTNSLEWLDGGQLPDEDTIFTVNYEFAQPVGITDLSPGSVVRTLVESVAREMEYLYEQLNLAYLAGYIDSATGDSLNMTVALLGINRKPAQQSSGRVIFGRANEPQRITVTKEAHLYDGSNTSPLNKENIVQILGISGTALGRAFTFGEADFTLAGREIRWSPEGTKPDHRTVFYVDYLAFQKIIVPKGVKVSTHSTKPEEVRTYITVEESSLRPSIGGRWEADVPIICTMPGKWGNVLAGTTNIMPQPVMGVEYVINKSNITNGTEEENDMELRQRAKHALDFAAKATEASLYSALRGIKGVNSILINDMPESIPGIVEAIVDGGDPEEIIKVIDDTRAAGIKVEFSRPKPVYIDVSMTLYLEKDADQAEASAQVEKGIRNYLTSLNISDDVLFSRVVEEIHHVKEVWDVRDIVITANKEEAEEVISEGKNIKIDINERAAPRNFGILFGRREEYE